MVTTGAVDAQQPATLPIEPYSANGANIPILFDANGNTLATPEIRQKPNVLATDDVSTTFFIPSQPDGAGHFLFTGTSAATPHVAGLAALLMQQAPTATVGDVIQYLEQNSNLQIITPPGSSPESGLGLIQMDGPLVVPTTPPTTPTGPTIPLDVETNQTSDTALNLGPLSTGQTTITTGQGIGPLPDGRNDYDWYRWEIADAGTFTTTEQTTAGSNLELHLFTLQGNTLVQLASAITHGVASSTLATAVAAGQVVLVEVKGENTSFGIMTQGIYNLSASLT